MKIKPIKTEADHAAALKRIEALWNATKPEDRDELDVLATLVDAYERVHHPIDPPDPIEAVKFRMEQQGWKLTDFTALIGSRSHSSEILSGKRPLNLAIIRKLHQAWRIPAAALLQEVKPSRRGRSTHQRRTALPLAGLVPKKSLKFTP